MSKKKRKKLHQSCTDQKINPPLIHILPTNPHLQGFSRKICLPVYRFWTLYTTFRKQTKQTKDPLVPCVSDQCLGLVLGLPDDLEIVMDRNPKADQSSTVHTPLNDTAMKDGRWTNTDSGDVVGSEGRRAQKLDPVFLVRTCFFVDAFALRRTMDTLTSGSIRHSLATTYICMLVDWQAYTTSSSSKIHLAVNTLQNLGMFICNELYTTGVLYHV